MWTQLARPDLSLFELTLQWHNECENSDIFQGLVNFTSELDKTLNKPSKCNNFYKGRELVKACSMIFGTTCWLYIKIMELCMYYLRIFNFLYNIWNVLSYYSLSRNKHRSIVKHQQAHKGVLFRGLNQENILKFFIRTEIMNEKRSLLFVSKF